MCEAPKQATFARPKDTFHYYSEDNSQQRCAFGHDSVITKTDHPEDSSKWLRSRTNTRRNSTSNHSREQDRTQEVFHEQHFYKTFCLSSRSRSRRRRTLIKVCCTIFSCFVFNKIFFMWIKCFMIRLILKIYKNIFESCSPVHRVEVAQHLEQETIFKLKFENLKTLDL